MISWSTAIDQTHKQQMKKKNDKQIENDFRNIQPMMICMLTEIYSSNEDQYERFMIMFWNEIDTNDIESTWLLWKTHEPEITVLQLEVRFLLRTCLDQDIYLVSRH